jgi:hypothetical protein
MADQLALHALDLELPHFVGEAAGREQAMASAAATVGIQLRPGGVRLRQLGIARRHTYGRDPEQHRLKAAEASKPPPAGRAKCRPYPAASHNSSRKYAAWPVVSSTPI